MLRDLDDVLQELDRLHVGLGLLFERAEGNHVATLRPEESAATAGFTPMRLQQFACGRAAARAALARIGARAPTEPITATTEGIPMFPRGFVGSISHKNLQGIAGVASRGGVRALGVDLEEDENSGEDDLLERVCTSNEVSLVSELSEAGLKSPATWLLSAKESVFKATYPYDGESFDFDDIELAVQPSEGTFGVVQLLGCPRPEIEGMFAVGGSWLVCVAIIRA